MDRVTLTAAEALPVKIGERKAVVLKSRLDLTMVKLLGEKIKTRFFSRLGFLKPKPQEIRLVYIDKYYEPFIIVGGRYAVDYRKKCSIPVKVNDEMQHVYILGKDFRPEPSSNVVKLEGEGHFHHEDEGYFILDKQGHEVLPSKLPYAPPEEQLEQAVKVHAKLRELRIPPREEIKFLRSRIAKRPPDAQEILNELFEVTHRTVMYRPMYELTLRDQKTGSEAFVEIDGTTGEVIRHRKG
jgi:hypothetical protein